MLMPLFIDECKDVADVKLWHQCLVHMIFLVLWEMYVDGWMITSRYWKSSGVPWKDQAYSDPIPHHIGDVGVMCDRGRGSVDTDDMRFFVEVFHHEQLINYIKKDSDKSYIKTIPRPGMVWIS